MVEGPPCLSDEPRNQCPTKILIAAGCKLLPYTRVESESYMILYLFVRLCAREKKTGGLNPLMQGEGKSHSS